MAQTRLQNCALNDYTQFKVYYFDLVLTFPGTAKPLTLQNYIQRIVINLTKL